MKFKLNKYIQDDIFNNEHPSDFELSNGYGVLILRLPYIKENHVFVVSYAFLIHNKEVYVFDRSSKEFALLGDFSSLYTYLDVRIDKILAKISRLQTVIEKLEDRLYENDIDSNFPNEWLMLKKELSLIERLMSHAMIAFGRFSKHYKSDLDEHAYRDLEEHLDRAFRFSKAALEKLDNLYNFYQAKMDEKMNKIMFILTIISAIFLPLTLITGFFGMNTSDLPLTQTHHGTLKATILATLFEIPFVIWIWRMIKKY
ncbi:MULTISPECIES: CorA family divalent cation transporter [unclassified Nitratiruptor]|uniref:CorA family divalent cation transporter n=1 Tax=unclassified Nitratiruptor TaxID=2624044 RepID=UPI001914E161|nr:MULTISPECIES: CorA family divalent cation transporter [unclassified Nitratiruptor]BCD60245.1 magnesium transporter [Nitratiruptor sp. YY08-10]BCD64266.1 magnesium transporter [Nitratiruptor sp. YY08-14]